MQGARRTVWRATQADCNAAARPNPTGQMGNLFLATSLDAQHPGNHILGHKTQDAEGQHHKQNEGAKLARL